MGIIHVPPLGPLVSSWTSNFILSLDSPCGGVPALLVETVRPVNDSVIQYSCCRSSSCHLVLHTLAPRGQVPEAMAKWL